jgi:hypothetical protein
MKTISPHGIPIRRTPVEIPALPSWHQKHVPVRIDVSLLDRAGLLLSEVITYSKWSVLVLRTAIRVIQILQLPQRKEPLMLKVLRVVGRVVKMAGTAVGVGGWALSFLSPEVAGIIAGVSFFLGDGIVLSGDIIDDGKLNNSFTLEEEETAAAKPATKK